MRINKQEFKKAITSCPTHFLGVSKDYIAEPDVVESYLPKDGEFVEMRKGTLHSTYIQFNTGSRLYIYEGKCSVYHYPNWSVYLYTNKGGRTMYYAIPV